MIFLWLGLLGIFFLFVGVLLFGAPYLPTLSPQLKTALDLLDLKKGDTMLELGCGDGRVVIAAAERGWKVVGYELNPLLVAVAWLRTRRYPGTRILWGNFWGVEWPQSEGTFVFLQKRFMPGLDKRMQKHGGRLASVAFEISGKKPLKTANGVYAYEY